MFQLDRLGTEVGSQHFRTELARQLRDFADALVSSEVHPANISLEAKITAKKVAMKILVLPYTESIPKT